MVCSAVRHRYVHRTDAQSVSDLYCSTHKFLLFTSKRRKAPCTRRKSFSWIVARLRAVKGATHVSYPFHKVGHLCGALRAQVVNLRQDLLLMSFKQRTAVTSLAFRTDAASAQLPLLASAGGDGRVSLWDLADRRLHHTMRAHDGAISRLQFLPRCGVPARICLCRADNKASDIAMERLTVSPAYTRHVSSAGF